MQRLTADDGPKLENLFPVLYGKSANFHPAFAAREHAVDLDGEGVPLQEHLPIFAAAPGRVRDPGEPEKAVRTLEGTRHSVRAVQLYGRRSREEAPAPAPAPLEQSAAPLNSSRDDEEREEAEEAVDSSATKGRRVLSASLEEGISHAVVAAVESAVEAAVASSSARVEERVRAQVAAEGAVLAAAAGGFAELAHGLKAELHEAVAAVECKVEAAIERVRAAAVESAIAAADVGKIKRGSRSPKISPRGLLGSR